MRNKMFFSQRKKIEQKEIQIENLQNQLSQTQSELNYVKNILFSGIDDFLNRFYKEPTLEEKQKLEKEYENSPTQIKDYVDTAQGKILFQTDYYPIQNFSSSEEEELSEILENVDSSFSDKLLEIIRTKNLNEVEVYKKANIDRRHFSKIRSNKDYRPTKDTVILLCLSMQLSHEEAKDLLTRAGFALSKSSKQDLIAEYFFIRKIYNIHLYKETLYKFGFFKD